MTGKYYLAYGSNLSRKQMQFRTPDAEIIGTSMLEGWRLLFRQYATSEILPLKKRELPASTRIAQ